MRRTLIGSLALALIVASVVALTVLRAGPRTAPAGTATPRAPLPATAQTPHISTATPLPPLATATIPRATATAAPATPEATATTPLIRPTLPAPTTTAPAATPTGSLPRDVQAIRARDLPETNSVTVIVLDGEEAHLDDTREVYPASTVKLPIYLTLAHRIRTGEVGVTWETRITVQPEDIVGGTGVLQNAPGSTHSVREIAQLMITESDNVAANLLLGRLGGGQDTSREHVLAGATVVDDYLAALGVRGMTLRHGLLDNQAYATGTLSTTTSAALAQIMLRTERDQATLDGATDALALLGERGAHNPWHPSDAVACGLTVQRIGGIYPASADRPGVRLDALIVATPGSAVRYILSVAVPTTPALERTVEAHIARFEGDLQLLLTGHWAQCVDSTTRQATP
jgi:beta-lactamase class A